MPEVLQSSHDAAGCEQLLRLDYLHLLPCFMPWHRCPDDPGPVGSGQGWDLQPRQLSVVLENVVYYRLLQTVLVILNINTITDTLGIHSVPVTYINDLPVQGLYEPTPVRVCQQPGAKVAVYCR